MKLLLLLVVIGVAVWWVSRRRPPADPRSAAAPPAAPAAMLACAHCGVHLPQTEAQFDVAGKPYCSAAHRLAGPR